MEAKERAKPEDKRALNKIRDFTFNVLARNAGREDSLSKALVSRVPLEYSHKVDYWRAFNMKKSVSAKRFETTLYQSHFKRKRIAQAFARRFKLATWTPHELGLKERSIGSFSQTKLKELSEELGEEHAFGWATYFILIGYPKRAKKFFKASLSKKRRLDKALLNEWEGGVNALRSNFHSLDGWRVANGLKPFSEHGLYLRPLEQEGRK